MNFQARQAARFLALSKRSKRIVVANILFAAVACGGLTRNIVSQNAPPRPIEVSYSSFMDLVEQQEQLDSTSKSSAVGNVPVMDQVRIGTDKIVYRLYRNVNGQQPEAPVVKGKQTRSGRAAARNLKRQQQQPYLTAYTRKIPASQELVSTLRKSDITFTAANAPRASVVNTAVRTFMIMFYFVILWRLYQQVSGGGAGGAGGMGGSKDTPGKLAQVNDLPMASFEDIMGIDQAKGEVMELVDALRNPDKYAILGARAPTGLLLEGPPGTGSTYDI